MYSDHEALAAATPWSSPSPQAIRPPPVSLSAWSRWYVPDGSSGPWHPGLDSAAVAREWLALRNAAFVLVIGLSMMRDSEIHGITKGSFIEHYGVS